MNRRDFVKLAGLTGLAVTTPWGINNLARAKGFSKYEGPLWITINADGGWDPTMLCDPKGGDVNSFGVGDIEEVGPFKVPPYDYVKAFFNKYKSKLMVMNGIDTSTFNHKPGKRFIWSGKLGEGSPAVAAMAAAAGGPELPMAFISHGGYDFTANLVAPSRAETADLDMVKTIAFPNNIDVAGSEYYFEKEIEGLIRDARAKRLAALHDNQHLPRIKRSMSSLFTARVGQKELKELTKFLTTPDSSDNPLRQQGQLAIAAYKAGLTVSANLVIGGFDTHKNHDVTQGKAMERLLDGVDYIMEQAKEQGVEDNVVVLVSSEFARTPGYNGNMGKDHWPFTSMLAMGPGIPGGKTVGATTATQGPMRIKPAIMEAVDDDDPTAVRLTPAHIHQALRKLAGIEDSKIAKAFPIATSGPALNIFGG
jgi:hypothetical protein